MMNVNFEFDEIDDIFVYKECPCCKIRVKEVDINIQEWQVP